MLVIQRSSLDLSSIIQSTDYSSLILPSILSKLTISPFSTDWIAMEARLEGKLVGLSLSEIFPLHKMATLSSLVIKPNYRHQGIGRQLFAFTEDKLIQEEKVQTIEVMYEQNDPFTPALEKILASLGWSLGRILLIRCHFNADTFNPPWIQHSYKLPFSMNFFSWKDLLPAERLTIEYLAQQGRFLPYLSPFREEELIDQDTSIGLRQNGVIVGWNITHRLDPSTIRYSSLYIDSHLLHTGYGIQLLAESIRRQKELSIPHALFEVNLMEIDPSWWRFVRKRLMPVANKIERIKRAMRLFTVFLD